MPAEPFKRLDGGYAWVIVLAGFTGSAMSLGTAYSIGGTLFLAWLEDFGSSRAALAPAVSLVWLIVFGGGVLWTLIIRASGSTRAASLIGAVVSVVSLLLVSLANGPVAVYLLFSVPFSIGAGLSFFTSTAVITTWFNKRRGLAQGIGAAGSGTGVVAVTLCLRALIDSHGWRTAVQIFAAIYGVSVGLASLAYLPPPGPVPTKPASSQMHKWLKELTRDRRMPVPHMSAPTCLRRILTRTSGHTPMY